VLEKMMFFLVFESKITFVTGDYVSEQVPLKYRSLIQRVKASENKSKAEAIKAFCLECVDYKYKRVQNCSAKSCALYQVRPYQKSTSPNKAIK
jgi:hypothetical protein